MENLDKDYAAALVNEKKYVELKKNLSEMNPADIAVLLSDMHELDDLTDHELVVLYRILPKELAAEAFTYLDSDLQLVLINAFTDSELRYVIDELFLDDTVDIIEEMPANVVSRILSNTDPETRQQINELLNYPEDSAGSVMTTEFVYLHKDHTVGQAFEKIRKTGLAKETVYTCYVTENRKLVGIVTLLDMIVAEPDTLIEDIMETNVVSVTTGDDKETAANTLSKYDLSAIPVVDNEDRIVGIITFDDALDVLEDEATEDIEKMAAITPSDKPYLKTSVLQIYKARIPWLMLLMISSSVTAYIIRGFDEALAAVTALSMFIPMLMDTGGNVGSQASVTAIRGLSLNEISFSDIFKVMWKEVRVALLCAVTLAVVLFLKVQYIDGQETRIAIVVSCTIFTVVMTAKFIGCSLPMIAKKVGFDPAVMASPFITTIVDALALVVYFTIASRVFSL